ncbi:asparagine--tRNA ligase [endosymbiont GvMRE of Glomus versiforme]|uniref:asparagine--tRNA ligase n=1 Tax=endosymbiont GvMRE of Glomus versiforme TaxID=2039283 RepID=UPI000ECE2197|nr:asparagine--tRNA ligase [endosymbiont GvMRE of Glomus versiforme]RHZ36417.1 Asparagine--tRNA ligase [endosymbiont GvMRE of Glomus versiforme]
MKPKTYKLREICEIKAHPGGWNIKESSNPIHWKNGTIPFYQIKDIQAGNLNPDKKLTIEAVNEWKLPLTTENSLLLSAIGTIGKVFYPRKEKCAFASTIICLEPNPDLVEPNYLHYLLQSQEKEIKNLAVGSTIPMLTKTVISTFLLPLPPLSQQQKILQSFQIVYNSIYKTEVQYQDTLLKILQKHLEIGDLLFLKYRDSEIRIKDKFKLVAGKTPPSSSSPLQKNKVPLEVVRESLHLRAKTNYFLIIFRLRHSINKAIHDFFYQEEFYYISTPIITSNDTEGAGETFNIATDKKEFFFSKPAKLTVSGQLQAEALAQGLGRVYTFSPCFRAENSHTTRHLAEFWMVEPEMIFADLETIINLAEKMIKYVINFVLDNNSAELEYLENYDKENKKEIINKIKKISRTSFRFKKISYNECIRILEKNKKTFAFDNIEWGMDLQSEHEKYLCQHFDNSPVFITDYPASLKAFYMKNNSDGKTVACFDLLFPRVGEMVGGSVRESNHQVLKDKAQKTGLDINNLSWYFDLRKCGYAPSGGFGLGLERLLMFLTDTENIRDVIPFPRYSQHLEC